MWGGIPQNPGFVTITTSSKLYFSSTHLFACGSSDLFLADTANLLHPVLPLLALLASSSSLRSKVLTGEPVLGFDFLCVVKGVVDQGETYRFATCNRVLGTVR